MLLAPPARFCAAATAVLAFLALAMKYAVAVSETGGTLPDIVWSLARYFTILTNALVLAVFGYMALTGRRIGDRLAAGLVVWIMAVGLVYRLLLAELWEPRGLEYLADLGVHTVVPLAVLGWWLAFAGTARLWWLDPVIWLAWPLAYLAYALARAGVDGIYPYPFLDPGRLSSTQLVWNVARLMEGFAAAGYVLLGLARLRLRLLWRAKRAQASRPGSSSR
ncbi:Pr6Pr family membrane protein [Psychromarinibacter sp. C21-152]|uniref:Pr6Pr family membrane protein n=1 Tax=Psychromarinibacter sediminicola TaxID=3033385 RepID=A0AAE3T8K9_9RHOB|nr:Pr6Pr family membrane protein [Psychromarinibacter sediminicola]MDF0600818.1 Pr6Pr family membrane protein [Psychromarinibacter sediminicola]